MSSTQTIDLQPGWSALVDVMLEAWVHATPYNKDVLRSEFKKMARAADIGIEAEREAARAEQRRFINAGYWNVTLFEINRAYGGPEEGGWYYDEGEPVENRLVLVYDEEDDAYAAADRWNYLLRQLNLNHGHRAVISEGREPVSFPSVKPRYE